MINYWITSYDKNFTCGFSTDKEGYIIKSAPIIKKFLGQHLSMLLLWVGNNKLVRQ